MSNEFDKIAQQRSFFGSPLNPIRRSVKKIFPEFKRQYKLVNDIDRQIRKDGENIKSLLKDLKAFHKNHRWFSVINTAAKINALVKTVVHNDTLDELLKMRKVDLGNFYFEGKNQDELEPIHSHINYAIKKQALFGELGRRITDTVFNFTGKEEKQVRRAINSIANKAESIGKRLLSIYKELDTAISRGNIGDYVSTLQGLAREHTKFEKDFERTYDFVKEYIPKSEEKDEKDSGSGDGSESETSPNKVPETQPVPQTVHDMTKGFPEEQPIGPQGLEPQQFSQTQTQESVDLGQMRSDIMQNYEREQQYNQIFEGIDPQSQEAWPLGRPATAAAAIRAIKQGHYGIGAAILSKYSQELEDEGDMVGSVKMIVLAEELLNGK